MEEAIEILWSYARREPLDSNGETIVPTVNNSIAAIRILSRLEGWEKGNSEERKMKNEEQKMKNEECSQPVSTAFVPQPTQSQPTFPEQTQYITPPPSSPYYWKKNPLPSTS